MWGKKDADVYKFLLAYVRILVRYHAWYFWMTKLLRQDEVVRALYPTPAMDARERTGESVGDN